MRADLTEARRLLDAGMFLVPLKPNTKRPEGTGWNYHRAETIEAHRTGYGLPLLENELCSIDPDQEDMARIGLKAWGFDLDALLSAGVRTTSTRPGSGGRAAFLDQEGLRWLRLKVLDETDTLVIVLELRAESKNLQDCVPGLVYYGKAGEGPYTQAYANGKTFAEAPELPADFAEFWRKLSTDDDFRREQERIFQQAIIDAGLAPAAPAFVPWASGRHLPYKSEYRPRCNESRTVAEILTRHGYTDHSGRWARPGATGAPGIRLIPGKDDLWQNDHGGDILPATFDAWCAFVVLDHNGDQAAAEAAMRAEERAQDSAAMEALKGLGAGPEADDSAAPNPDGFTTASWDSITPEGEPAVHIVQNLLALGELSLVHSQPNTGKSALALDLAIHIAGGRRWYDYQTFACNVLYVAAESPASIKARILAAKKQTGIKTLPIEVVQDAIRLTEKEDRNEFAKKLAATLQGKAGAWFIIVDTFRAATPGLKENDSDTMGGVVGFFSELAKSLQAHILVNHHTTKAGTSYAGSGTFGGLVDTEISLATEQGAVRGKVEQQRSLPSKGDIFWYITEAFPTGRTTNFLEDELQPLLVKLGGPPAGDDQEGASLVAVANAVLGDPDIPLPFTAGRSAEHLPALARILGCGENYQTIQRHLNVYFPEGQENALEVVLLGRAYHCFRAKNNRRDRRLEYHVAEGAK